MATNCHNCVDTTYTNYVDYYLVNTCTNYVDYYVDYYVANTCTM